MPILNSPKEMTCFYTFMGFLCVTHPYMFSCLHEIFMYMTYSSYLSYYSRPCFFLVLDTTSQKILLKILKVVKLHFIKISSSVKKYMYIYKQILHLLVHNMNMFITSLELDFFQYVVSSCGQLR